MHERMAVNEASNATLKRSIRGRTSALAAYLYDRWKGADGQHEQWRERVCVALKRLTV